MNKLLDSSVFDIQQTSPHIYMNHEEERQKREMLEWKKMIK